jgi:hypothetical protein
MIAILVSDLVGQERGTLGGEPLVEALESVRNVSCGDMQPTSVLGEET